VAGARREVINETELRVVGMSRSGNHAIIDWILAEARGRTCFLNCAEPRTNPFATARPLGRDEPGWRANYQGFDPARERRGELSRKDLLIHSYEDVFLGYLCHPAHELMHDAILGRSRRRFDLLILRDACRADRRQLQRLGREPRLQAPPRGAARTELRRLRRRGGSSFDGRRLDGRAQEMALFGRWRTRAGDRAYRSAFSPSLVALSERIFGRIPGTERIPLRGPEAMEVAA
jgi:hypothetical protein